MTRIFGPVASLYDDVRPGYPAAVGPAIRAFHGRDPATIVELGAGTGKGTAALSVLGGRLTCLEPDPRMASILQTNFPGVRLERSTFEDWTAPAGGVDVIACALAWHWLDPATRNRRARSALAPGGTLAVFGHKYGYADRAVADAISGVLRSVDSKVVDRDDHWLRHDVESSGEFGHVEEQVWHTYPSLPKADYLKLVQTFSPFRKRSPEDQRAALTGLDAALDRAVTLDLLTTLVLAGVER